MENIRPPRAHGTHGCARLLPPSALFREQFTSFLCARSVMLVAARPRLYSPFRRRVSIMGQMDSWCFLDDPTSSRLFQTMETENRRKKEVPPPTQKRKPPSSLREVGVRGRLLRPQQFRTLRELYGRTISRRRSLHRILCHPRKFYESERLFQPPALRNSKKSLVRRARPEDKRATGSLGVCTHVKAARRFALFNYLRGRVALAPLNRGFFMTRVR